MLLPGEKELADKLLNLTKTARDQEATIPEQCKIFHEMGELYLKDAIETGNGEQFVKASALINAALVRAEDPRDQTILQGILCDVYKGLLKNIEGATLNVSVEELVAIANCNKDHLHAIRYETFEMCKDLERSFNSYIMEQCLSLPRGKKKEKIRIYMSFEQNAREKQTRTEMNIVQEVKQISLRVQRRMLAFIERLWEQATKLCSVPVPCKYAVVGLGSLARREITPYSDLEFALLIEKETPENRKYFKNLVYLFHLFVLDLGETPIPSMAIESLNCFMTPDGDRFYDMITPRGFRLDGAMPWACKTPIGRKGTPLREPLDLIKTPDEMVALLREDNVLGLTYKVADILCNSILICGDLEVFEAFTELSNKALTGSNHKEKARKSLIEDYNRSPDWNIKRSSYYSLENKQLFYRVSSSFVENLRMYFAPHYQPNSNWKVLEYLYKRNILSAQGTNNLKVQLAFCYGFRLLTYLKNRGQHEHFAFMYTMDCPFEKARPRHLLKTRSRCIVAYFENGVPLERAIQGSNGLRRVTEKYFLVESRGRIEHLRGETFIQVNDELEFSDYAWFRHARDYGNLEWARLSKELPRGDCGSTCHINELILLSNMYGNDCPSLLRGIDVLIGKRNCACLSLLRTSLLVTKAILIDFYMMKGRVPKEGHIAHLYERYRQKRYKNVRERFYLLVDMTDLAFLCSDTYTRLAVIKDVTTFLGEIDTFEESEQTMVNMMKYQITENLIKLYTATGFLDLAVQLCQQQIDELERKVGVNSGYVPLGKWYVIMGNIKLLYGLTSQALDCFQECFDIHQNLNQNKRFTGIDTPQCFEESFKSNHRRIIVRRLALSTAKLYVENKRPEDAINMLIAALTRNGKSFEIETDEDMQAMILLIDTCRQFDGSDNSFNPPNKYKLRANQYFEELLVAVVQKGQGHLLSPDTVVDIVIHIFGWITYLGPPFKSYSYIIKDLYRKHCEQISGETISKEEFLIEIICKVVDNESTHKYFLEGTYLTSCVAPHHEALSSTCNTWDGFFFALCTLSVDTTFNVVMHLPWMVKFRTVVLQQAEIFCEKVVKNIVSETIHKMCLIFINFNRIRLMLYEAGIARSLNGLTSAMQLARIIHLGLLVYFPHCPTALKLTDTEDGMFKCWI